MAEVREGTVKGIDNFRDAPPSATGPCWNCSQFGHQKRQCLGKLTAVQAKHDIQPSPSQGWRGGRGRGGPGGQGGSPFCPQLRFQSPHRGGHGTAQGRGGKPPRSDWWADGMPACLGEVHLEDEEEAGGRGKYWAEEVGSEGEVGGLYAPTYTPMRMFRNPPGRGGCVGE